MWVRRKPFVVFLVTAVLLAGVLGSPALASVEAEENEATATAMAFDLLILRPFGFAAFVLGSAFFVVSLPFSAISGNTKEAGKFLVIDPAKYTFIRTFGQLDP